MKKFKFTMQSLLNIKISIEKQLKNSLAEAQERLSNSISELDALKARKEIFINNYKRGLARTNSHDIKIYSEFFVKMDKLSKEQINKIEEYRREMAEIEQELLNVITERKIFEKLKEKQLEDYKSELGKEQEKEIDDVLSYKVTESQVVKK